MWRRVRLGQVGPQHFPHKLWLCAPQNAPGPIEDHPTLNLHRNPTQEEPKRVRMPFQTAHCMMFVGIGSLWSSGQTTRQALTGAALCPGGWRVSAM